MNFLSVFTGYWLPLNSIGALTAFVIIAIYIYWRGKTNTIQQIADADGASNIEQLIKVK